MWHMNATTATIHKFSICTYICMYVSMRVCVHVCRCAMSHALATLRAANSAAHHSALSHHWHSQKIACIRFQLQTFVLLFLLLTFVFLDTIVWLGHLLFGWAFGRPIVRTPLCNYAAHCRCGSNQNTHAHAHTHTQYFRRNMLTGMCMSMYVCRCVGMCVNIYANILHTKASSKCLSAFKCGALTATTTTMSTTKSKIMRKIKCTPSLDECAIYTKQKQQRKQSEIESNGCSCSSTQAKAVGGGAELMSTVVAAAQW